jgi:hypothetical protein
VAHAANTSLCIAFAQPGRCHPRRREHRHADSILLRARRAEQRIPLRTGSILKTRPGQRVFRIGHGQSDSDEPQWQRFLIERRFAEDLEASAEVNDRINRINEEEGVRWLYSFLSADKRKTYCLYEAPEADAIRRAASRAGLPADAVIELAGRVFPDGSFAELPAG